MASEPDCILKKSAEQLARKKQLLKQGGEIICQYASVCNGLRCLLAEEAQTRTIYLYQQGEQSIPSDQDRFYARLKKHFQR